MNTMKSKSKSTRLTCFGLLKGKTTHPEVSGKTSKDFSEMRTHRHVGPLGPLLSHLYPGPVTKPVSTNKQNLVEGGGTGVLC